MNATLEDRLRRHYDERTHDIPAHGPGLDDRTLLTIRPATSQPQHLASRLALTVGSLAAAVIGAVVLLDRSSTDQPAATNSTTADTTEIAEPLSPVDTLPDGPDVSDTPVTVLASAPTDWYRLQPDLDVAWYHGTGTQSRSMLCWRTPVGSECVPDEGADVLPLIVPTAGGQTLVVTRGTTGPATLDVQLTGGGVLSAPLEIDDTISWGVARYQLPDGVGIMAIGTAPMQVTEPSDVPTVVSAASS
jgi:hypothetical protein